MLVFRPGSLALVCLSIVGTISAAFAGNPDSATVQRALSHSHSAGVIATKVAAAPCSATDPTGSGCTAPAAFTLHGIGTEGTVNLNGTCFGGPCTSSSGDCACIPISGTSATASPGGTGSWSSKITVNTDDCVNTGDGVSEGDGVNVLGFCCTVDGILNIDAVVGKNTSVLSMSLTGTVCDDPNTTDVKTTDDADSIEAAFIFLPSKSTGSFSQTTGTGTLNLLIEPFFTAPATLPTTNAPVYMSGTGVIQSTSPFKIP